MTSQNVFAAARLTIALLSPCPNPVIGISLITNSRLWLRSHLGEAAFSPSSIIEQVVEDLGTFLLIWQGLVDPPLILFYKKICTPGLHLSCLEYTRKLNTLFVHLLIDWLIDLMIFFFRIRRCWALNPRSQWISCRESGSSRWANPPYILI